MNCNNLRIGDQGFGELIGYLMCLIEYYVIPMLIALAVAGFIYGVVKFYMNPDNEEGRKKGKDFIIGGLIALFVIVAMWGLVSIVGNTFVPGFQLKTPAIKPANMWNNQ